MFLVNLDSSVISFQFVLYNTAILLRIHGHAADVSACMRIFLSMLKDVVRAEPDPYVGIRRELLRSCNAMQCSNIIIILN